MSSPTLTCPNIEDKRRSLRMRKSSLLKLDMTGIDRPDVKIAETLDEYKQAFRLAHDEYVDLGYISPSLVHPYHYTWFSLLPETSVFVFKTFLTVVATLTQIVDTPTFGLPMDSLYRKEIDALRAQGRTVVEISSFVTSRSFRMRNIMIYLCKAMFNYSQINKIDDICIMVNPKHVQFYTRMFLFEAFGPERFYEKVHAPAVPLRADMRTVEEKLHEAYSQFEFTEDLYSFFCRMNTTVEMLETGSISSKKHRTPQEVLNYFGKWDMYAQPEIPLELDASA